MLIALYDSLYTNIGDDRLFATLMMSIAHTVPVMCMQAFLMLIGKYGIFQDYVIQPNKKAEADLGIKCWINSGINHFVEPFLYLLHEYTHL
jgi:hypothetical protein